MKKMITVLSIIFAVIMTLSTVCISTAAANADSTTVKFLNTNVAGLPDFKALLGKGDKNVAENEKKIGSLINDLGFDVVAVQEDFSYHDELISGMNNYGMMTNTTGTIPGGDGLNIFTKSIKIYDETRVKWNSVYGGIAEGDPLTPKGFLYTVLELDNGITVDFYDLHADAFDGGGNALARADEYQQLLTYIEEHSANRPVIITGDFNTSMHWTSEGDNGADERAMRELIFGKYGYKDAWTEVKNGGDYVNYSQWYKTGIDYWGNWDSVEKLCYRNGGGVEITVDDFDYIVLNDENGNKLSDHSAAGCTFTFTKTADYTADTRTHKVASSREISKLFNHIRWIFLDLEYIFSHFDELLELAGVKIS